LTRKTKKCKSHQEKEIAGRPVFLYYYHAQVKGGVTPSFPLSQWIRLNSVTTQIPSKNWRLRLTLEILANARGGQCQLNILG